MLSLGRAFSKMFFFAITLTGLLEFTISFTLIIYTYKKEKKNFFLWVHHPDFPVVLSFFLLRTYVRYARWYIYIFINSSRPLPF